MNPDSHGVEDPAVHDHAVQDLSRFIEASPSPYHAASEATRRLVEAGFSQLSVGDPLPADGPVVVRHEGFVLAWNRQGQAPTAPMRLVGAHTDSPNLRVRPHPDRATAGWQQLGVEVYGGALLNSWLDRDLGLSGRVAVGRDDVDLREVRWDRPLLRVPQLAIHLDREIHTEGLTLNKQQHMTPVWGVGDVATPGGFRSWLGDELDVDPATILAWDLMTHDLTPPARLGRSGELFAAPRLDNLCSSWAGVTALIASVSSGANPPATGPVPVLVLSDHEEVGSTSGVGAASGLIRRLLEASIRAAAGAVDPVASAAAIDTAWAGTVVASADMAHATHPNYADRHEGSHFIAPGKGTAVKVNSNQRYASDARTTALLHQAAARVDLTLQTYSHRGDLPCGSTIGPTMAATLGVGVVDLGAPMLSMHSARELMATDDIEPLARLLTAWFGS